MRRAKKDANHDALAAVFRQMGCSVADLVSTGIPGWPDICVGAVGLNHLVECKNPETAYGRAGLNANQQAFARDWRGGKVYTVATTEDVITLVNRWRRTR